MSNQQFIYLLFLHSALVITYCCQQIAGQSPASCKISKIPESNVVISDEDGRNLSSKNVYLFEGDKLTFRCEDIGKFSFSGERTWICTDRGFVGKSPKCRRLKKYDGNSPPIIEYGINKGYGNITTDGKLMLEKGATARLSCLWWSDDAEWNWNHRPIAKYNFKNSRVISGPNYLDLWLYSVQQSDSGYYSCNVRSTDKSHGFDVIVIDEERTTEAIRRTTKDRWTVLRKATTPMPDTPGPNSCSFTFDRNLFAFVNGRQLKDNSATLPFGKSITFRCPIIGKYKFNGQHTYQCNERFSSTNLPTCTPLNHRNTHLPPVITYEAGFTTSISEDGTLNIPEGTDVILSCWWFRNNGHPIWQYDGNPVKSSNTFENWKDVGQLDLHIENIRRGQSGYYSCSNPYRQTNGIQVSVFK